MPRVNLIQLRGGTAAAWTSANPVLDAREPGIETDTRKIKFGDGSTAWNSLAYAAGGSGDALVANPLSQFAATTSNQLAGVISDETGTGALVFANSPTFVTPALGTPASGVLTNCTGTAAGLTAGSVTTNANLTGHVTSVGNAAVLGSFTKAQLNAAVSDGDVLYVGDAPTSHVHAGADITTGTVDPARLGSGTSITTKFLRGDSTWQTVAGGGDALVANPLSQFASTTSAQLAGVISDETGSGALVFATSPTLVTPALGTPASGVATNLTGTAAGLTAGNATALATARNIDGVSFNGSANITVIAPATVAATSKTTPVDADVMPIADSAASNVLKKLTWANLKATLKTYFDTLYAATGSTGSLTVIAGTDADTTLTVNRHYELEADILTANRTYTIPSGTTGDRIRISLAKGSSTRSLIIKANTGVQINRGTLAAEWSRLFIVAEYVELRCTNGTNWDVWDDGRVANELIYYPGSNITLTNGAWVELNFSTQEKLVGITNSSGVYTIRRSGSYLMGQEYYMSDAGSSLAPSTTFALWVAVTKNGNTSTGTYLSLCTQQGTGTVSGFHYPSVAQPMMRNLVAGDTIRWNCLQTSSADRRIDALSYNTLFCKEML